MNLSPGEITRFGRRQAVVFPLMLLALSWVCYRSALDYPFIQDDYHHMWESLWRGWESLPHLLTLQLPFYRPVSNAWYFAIGHAIWKLNPVPYHIINILAYVVSAWCVGVLGTRLFRSAAVGQAAGVIFLTTVGHLLAIYWICVMTAGWLIFWFLVAWVCDRFAWETGRRRWRVLAALAYGLCVFSNVTGFTLATAITLSARFMEPRPSWRVIAKHHWPFYAWGLLWLVLQFGVLGWPSLSNYAVGLGHEGVAGRLVLLALFTTYAVSPLYLLVLREGANAWGPFALGLGALVALGVWRYRAMRAKPDGVARDRGGLLLCLFVVAWGLAPYLVLSGHFAPYHVGIASIGVSLALGWLFGRTMPRPITAGVVGLWLCVSLVAIRAYEDREHTTKGIGWKATLAENIVTDVGGIIAMHPDMRRLVIINHNEHLWWFFEHGNVADLYHGVKNLDVVDGGDGSTVRPAPGQVVVRYSDMHLHLLTPDG